jgi:hypothetical protein
VERGDTGLGRDAYGVPRRRRLGDRRGYRFKDDPVGSEADDDEYYGQLLRRPGEQPPPSQQAGPQQAGPQQAGPQPPMAQQAPSQQAMPQRPRPGQPGRPYPRPPGRFGPPPGNPAGGFPPNGVPGHGNPAGGPPNGSHANGGPPYGGGVNSGGENGGPLPGHQYRLPNGRRVPPRDERPYRPQDPGQAPGPAGVPAGGARPGPVPGQDPLSGWTRAGRPYRAPGVPPSAGAHPYSGVPGADVGPGRGPGAAGMPGEPRAGGADGWDHLNAPRVVPGAAAAAEPPGPAGPVIKQRDTAKPDGRPMGTSRALVSIAPDGLESFARDLRALRAKAELDYPEMAEMSHYTMKTLASAAGGLRLPALPVAVAYVRACAGDVAEWEDRWQKLAERITAEAAKKRRSDGEEAPPEPADTPAIPEPPALPAASDPDPDPGEVYVITSAKPRQPGW